MATLRREWISVEQVQQWVDTYDPKWMSQQIVDAMTKEMIVGRQLRWHHAIIVDATTHVCHEGLMKLLAVVQAQQAQMCWIASADDFNFAEGHLGQTAEGVSSDPTEDGYGGDHPAHHAC
jgi:hypothetical protein